MFLSYIDLPISGRSIFIFPKHSLIRLRLRVTWGTAHLTLGYNATLRVTRLPCESVRETIGVLK